MKMTLRWFGEDDSIPLHYIAQIPRVSGVVTSLIDIPAGEVWPLERVLRLRDVVQNAGLSCEVIESVNIHESIKLGARERDEMIENYIKTMKNLHEIGIQVICYNFMPVLDWVRSDLFFDLPDGSRIMKFNREYIESITPQELAERYAEQSGGAALPGWEPESLAYINSTIEQYEDMTTEKYMQNAKYFLDAVIPYAEIYDIRLAVHPDDPPTPLFGLPRIVNSSTAISRYLDLNSSMYNGLTLCTGSLGADPLNNVVEIAEKYTERIHFAHIRNIKHIADGEFIESAHPTECGSLDIYEVVKALVRNGFDGYIRPDHGRMIWGENSRPGYGLYDRALGAAYILGLWEGISNECG